MLPPFDLSVPTDARFRSMAPDVAAKYAELAGCAPAAATAVRGDVDAATTKMASAGENIDIKCAATETGVVFTMTCGAESAVVRASR